MAQNAIQLIKPNAYMASIDIKDAFFSYLLRPPKLKYVWDVTQVSALYRKWKDIDKLTDTQRSQKLAMLSLPLWIKELIQSIIMM